MYFKRHILIGLFFIFFAGNISADLPENVIIDLSQTAQIDSSKIETLTPSKEKENGIFSDSKLKYKETVSAQKGMFDRFLEWLAEKLFGNAGYENVLTAREIILWTVCIISLGIVIWLLSRSELASLIKAKPKATAFNFMDITEDLDKINFEEKIKAAVVQGDYSHAIRWHYLKILFLLDKDKLIEFASYKTNIDYKYEIKNKKLQDGFMRLSYIYEYIWYGKFVIGITDYSERETEFNDFEKQIHV